VLGPGVEFAGELDGPGRTELLRGAIALLDPIRWAEPFGLVMVEALACGTPVLVSPLGAAPEIVDDGVTGFLCADDDAFVAALARVGSLEGLRNDRYIDDSRNRATAGHQAAMKTANDEAPLNAPMRSD